MSWERSIKDFKSYLRIERSLSDNSILAYIRDITKFSHYAVSLELDEFNITRVDIGGFLLELKKSGVSARSQARILSGVRAFYRYLIIEDYIKHDPTELIESPRIGLNIPDTLTIIEIDKLISAVDLGTPHGERNRSILETLYSCGLRVSELINLKLSNIYFNEGYLKVTGKGDKERLAPIGGRALKYLDVYINQVRNHQKIRKGHDDFVFLNNRGARLTRVMIFIIIQKLKDKIGLKKNISPVSYTHLTLPTKRIV